MNWPETSSTYCRHGRKWYRCCDPEANLDSWTYRPIKRVPPINIKGLTSVEVKPGAIYVGQAIKPSEMPAWFPYLAFSVALVCAWAFCKVLVFCYAALTGWWRA